MEEFAATPTDASPLETVEALLRTLEPLSLPFDLLKVQNIHFSVGKELGAEMRERAAGGDEEAAEWLARFERLGDYLQLRSA